MIERRNTLVILCVILLLGLAGTARPEAEVYPQNLDVSLEYDDNVTREELAEDYQDGIVWRLYTGFGVRGFIPVKGLDTRAEYTLGMRDVSTTNDEDYSSHKVVLSSNANLREGTRISLGETFKIWNSQSDLFNFYGNRAAVLLDQSFGKRTSARLSYTNELRRFQNSAEEVQARNFNSHQVGVNLNHDISAAFKILAGYVHQSSTYNRVPLDFRGGREIRLDGMQRDRLNVVTLGFQAFLFNDTTILTLQNDVVRSNSNSRAFNFNGNRARIWLVGKPIKKLRVWFTYQLVAYDLAAYQTQEMGYELSEIRTDDQSGMKLGATYDISDQVSLKLGYEQIENTVFFTREFYKENIFSTGLSVKF